ncbi:MAG: ferrous iron transport protein B, partial [Acidobacteriota bacterium]
LLEMEGKIEAAGFLAESYPARWTALKYIEADEEVIAKGSETNASFSAELESMVAGVADHLKKTMDTYPEAIIADHRYGYISAVLKSGVVRRNYDGERIYLSEKIDKVVTNRFLGPIIMGLILYGLYAFTFTYSKIPVGWIEAGISALGGFAGDVIPEGPLRSLVVSGVIDGVGGVIGFVPIIVFMFLGVSVLEDSGYLARAAFMLDRIFRIFGLHGSSFMAYVVGGGIAGGCGVPGIMATRTLRSSKERLATILTVPFMNCGAKLPVFALLIAAFFPENEAGVMFALTIVSWGMAFLISKLLRSTILRGPSTPFLLELPPYRLPTLRGILIHTWERAWLYLKKAGTVLLSVSILLWAGMHFPGLPDAEKAFFEAERQAVVSELPQDQRVAALAGEELPEDAADVKEKLTAIQREEAQAALKNSIAGRLGVALESVTRYAGFDWRTNVALVGGFAAKEVVVATLGTAYSMGEVDAEESTPLSEQLAKDPAWSPLTAFSLIIFCLLYTPCVVSIITIVREAGGWKWGIFSMAFNTTIAFLMAVLVYQGGRLLGIGV